MIVVLDSNIVVSAAFFGGKPNQCLRVWLRDRTFEIAASPAILDEYEETIGELSRKYKQVSNWLPAIRLLAQIVIPPSLPPICRDPDDDVYIETAVAVGADYIVSGDNDLLDLKTVHDIPVVTVAAFLVIIG